MFADIILFSDINNALQLFEVNLEGRKDEMKMSKTTSKIMCNQKVQKQGTMDLTINRGMLMEVEEYRYQRKYPVVR